MSAVAEAIRKVATGPHLSKDLSREQAFAATSEILAGAADPVQAAVFLIAMRMKRETNEENLGILQALQAVTEQRQCQVERLLVMAEPFNGFNRHCPVSAFVPAVLAACGLPTLSQGVYQMGPKFGVTHAQVLALAGIDVNQSVAEAASAIDDVAVGWAYLDQAQATPALFALQDLRTRIIKRPSLATLEKLIMPLQARRDTHLAVGFVHKAYPEPLAWLAQQHGYASAFICRGIEGGIVPTLRESSNNFRMVDGELVACNLDPLDFAIEQDTRGVTNEQVSAADTVEQGMQALNGKAGPAFDSLVYGAAIMLWHTGLQPTPALAAQHVREVIRSGKAKMHFDKGLA